MQEHVLREALQRRRETRPAGTFPGLSWLVGVVYPACVFVHPRQWQGTMMNVIGNTFRSSCGTVLLARYW